jgi:hypothetical protein
MSDADDVKRAVAVLNIGMREKWFPEGGIPESDADKLVEAEKLVVMAQQAKTVADAVGHSKVPTWPGIRDILFEAQVLVSVNGDSPESEQTSTSSSQSLPSSEPVVISSQPVSTSSENTADQSSSSSLDGSASSISPPPAPPEQTELLPTPQTGETWAAAGGGHWIVLRDLDAQLEVQSVETGEKTMVPGGFLKEKIAGAPKPVVERIELVIDYAGNSCTYSHPECTQWANPDVPQGNVVPDDGSIRIICAGCGKSFPLTSVTEINKPEPAPEPEPVQQDKSEPVVESMYSDGTIPPHPESISDTGAPVEDDGGDEQYAALLDRVERNFTPTGMPAPQDLENPPSGMPEDLTQNEIENRRLHSQFNALSSRARYLYAIENAKARDCGRVRKLYMKPAMRLARQELGKSATQTEVVQLAEDDEKVKLWLERQADHADRADAYKTFFEDYSQNVAVLSRDLTWAGTEERGS